VAAGIIIGDMAYADGDGNRWDTWGRLMEQTFAQLPLMVVPGNHEIDYDAETSMAFAPYRARFRMPSKLVRLCVCAGRRVCLSMRTQICTYTYLRKYVCIHIYVSTQE